MPKNRKPYGISGEPWHIEYLRTESNDDRRDKRRCLYFEKSNFCGKKGERCIGSSHCSLYKEKESRPKALKYYHEDGRYYHVKDSVEKTNYKSAAFVGDNRKNQDSIIPYKDYVEPKIKMSTYKIVRYAAGTEVESKSLGRGLILSSDGGHYSVQFSTKTSTFLMDAFDKGYLKSINSGQEDALYQVALTHPYLPAFYVIESDSEASAWRAVEQVKQEWEKQWNKRINSLKEKLHSVINCMEAANRQTVYAAQVRRQLELFTETNFSPKPFTFDEDNPRRTFPEREPNYPQFYPIPREPIIEDYGQLRKMGFFQRLFKLSPIKISRVSRDQYESDHLVWIQNKEWAEQANSLLYQEYAVKHSLWEQARDAFYLDEEKRIQSSRTWHLAIRRGDLVAIERYFRELVNNIEIPLYFQKKFSVEYDIQTGDVVVDFCLPNLKAIPRAKRTIYEESNDCFVEEYYSYEATQKLYEMVNKQIINVISNTIKTGARAEEISISSVIVKGYEERIDEKMKQVVRFYL